MPDYKTLILSTNNEVPISSVIPFAIEKEDAPHMAIDLVVEGPAFMDGTDYISERLYGRLANCGLYLPELREGYEYVIVRDELGILCLLTVTSHV
jgi:hypothetical protein